MSDTCTMCGEPTSHSDGFCSDSCQKAYDAPTLEHAPTPEECPVDECTECGTRDCPLGEPGHYWNDGCPACRQVEALMSSVVLIDDSERVVTLQYCPVARLGLTGDTLYRFVAAGLVGASTLETEGRWMAGLDAAFDSAGLLCVSALERAVALGFK